MKDWIKNAVIFVLAMNLVYGFFVIRAEREAVQLLVEQSRQLADVLQNQCKVMLERQGFHVQLTPKASSLPGGQPAGMPQVIQEPEKE